ncbi:glycosyltransferase family 39 protein [Lusitaniella coriacea]|uniref:glycosyltransferase family 39 protein n=1 Tax=Lusitaniella coriacea TaxID=1983105 RepID=UPI003CF5444E
MFSIPRKTGKLLIIAVLILGIFFRFANLDRKVYSADEVRKILRLSGSTSQNFIEQVFTGEIINAEEIQQYQKLTPDRSLSDALHALAGNSEHPPLYMLLTRFLMQIFNAPITARIFAVVLGLLALPCVYWCCLELFGSSQPGWIAMALVAISPFHIMAAQNATQYSLFAVTTALSSAALLKALREQKTSNWVVYAATLTMGFYTHLFFAFVALSQGIYVFLNERFRLTQNFTAYLTSAVGSFLLFTPWIFVIYSNLDKLEKNIRYYQKFDNSLRKILSRFIANVGNTFLDFHNSSQIEKYFDYLLLILVIYAFYILCRYTPMKVWSFIVLLALVTALAQIVPDLISPSIRSLQARYYLPCFLAIEVAVAYLIAHQMSLIGNWKQNLGKLGFVLLLCCGIFSGVAIVPTQDWGLDDQKGTASSVNLDVAPVLNAASNPLLISEATHSFILALSYLVEPKVKFQLLQPQDAKHWEENLDLEANSKQFSDLFLYFPDQEFLDFIERDRNFNSQPIIKDKLYKLSKK